MLPSPIRPLWDKASNPTRVRVGKGSNFMLKTALKTVAVPTTTGGTCQLGATQLLRRGLGRFLFGANSASYVALVLMASLAAGAYSLRHFGIFRCSIAGYGSDAYLGYCGATSYGDYDHGAIWFGLEPAARAAAASAQVLFIGNSRTQFAFSSKATADWFLSHSESYYLLGFSHFENYTFEAPLLRKLVPRAKAYVINIDSFFERSETGPGKTVMRDEGAENRYVQKRQWQAVHKAVCKQFNVACGNELAIFRSRSTGSWRWTGEGLTSAPVSYSEEVDQHKLASYTALGGQYLPTLPVERACIILTIVPTVETDFGTAQAIAAALGSKLIAPKLAGLNTFDHYHLDQRSAHRWSTAFLEAAEPQIQNCLSR